MKRWKRTALIFLALLLVGAAVILGLNVYVVKSAESRIIYRAESRQADISAEEIKRIKEKDADCILILGAKVRKDGSPSYMLQDRLDLGIMLYKAGVAPKLLLSGDHGQVQYDEVNAMKEYAMKEGIPKEDLFLDHAGFSTYDSVYRAKEIFGVQNIIIVTQGYHLYRALYGCEKKEMNAWGAAADQTVYRGQKMRDLREIAARDKDVLKWIINPEPTYLGESIPISGSGLASQD